MSHHLRRGVLRCFYGFQDTKLHKHIDCILGSLRRSVLDMLFTYYNERSLQGYYKYSLRNLYISVDNQRIF
jgi:hypothetical protein